MKLEISGQIFKQFSNIKISWKSVHGSRVDRYGRTDMTKLTVTFRNVAKVPKNISTVNLIAYRKENIDWRCEVLGFSRRWILKLLAFGIWHRLV